MQHFPTPPKGALGSPEPEAPRYHLLHQASGEVCNDKPFTQAEVDRLRNALPKRATGPSPGPLPTRPCHRAAEAMAGGSAEVERSATHACLGSTADVQEAGDRVAAVARDPGEEELFPAEHPFIRLEPATHSDDTPHVCATDGMLLFKGNVSHALLHAYAHPSTPHRQT
jgi:hypothetical protein